MTQLRRWGLLRETRTRWPTRCSRSNCIARPPALGIALPDTAMRSATLMDGKHWDGSDPATYARSFALHAMASPAMAAL